MSLDEYHKKRDFGKTPEPEGVARKISGRKFVIQKHAASRLHYDLRLEHNGVLKSWAVPKGPSMDKTVKRLAIPTEDHPVDYADFEGIIPKEEYGGGRMIIWDRGLYEPLGDMDKQLEKGHLKFVMAGRKVEGAFSLTRTDKNWLLVKMDDEYEGKDIDDEKSVVSGKSLEDFDDN